MSVDFALIYIICVQQPATTHFYIDEYTFIRCRCKSNDSLKLYLVTKLPARRAHHRTPYFCVPAIGSGCLYMALPTIIHQKGWLSTNIVFTPTRDHGLAAIFIHGSINDGRSLNAFWTTLFVNNQPFWSTIMILPHCSFKL